MDPADKDALLSVDRTREPAELPEPKRRRTDVSVYLVVRGRMLVDKDLPAGCTLIRDVPATEPLLTVLNAAETTHVYTLPVTQPLKRLVARWSPLHNEQHLNPNFETELTLVEEDYLKIIRSRHNPLIKLDISGKWSGGSIDRGVGIVGGGDAVGVPQNTILFGFDNK